jgi:hypothetical protein
MKTLACGVSVEFVWTFSVCNAMNAFNKTKEGVCQMNGKGQFF